MDHGVEANVLEAYLGIAFQRSMFTDSFIRSANARGAMSLGAVLNLRSHISS